MKDFITALKTNENDARTKTLIAASITVAVVGVGIYLSQKAAPAPGVLGVEEVTEVVSDAAQV